MTEHLHRETNQSYYQLVSGFAHQYWSLPVPHPRICLRFLISRQGISSVSGWTSIITEIRVCILLVSWSWVELRNDECLDWRMIYHNSWLTGLLSPSSPPSYNFQHFSSNKKQNPLWVKDLWRCSIESQSFQAVVSSDYGIWNISSQLKNFNHYHHHDYKPLMYSGVK